MNISIYNYINIIASGRASWGPKGPSERERALTATRVVSPPSKLDLIFNSYRHSVRTDISWSNMPLIMFMGADILFVYLLFRCQSSTSLATY